MIGLSDDIAKAEKIVQRLQTIEEKAKETEITVLLR
jgi:hypothetical protein